ncbi:MAG: hypothetical protein MJ131_10090 [Lachnospiraceae bacterium]|nr:hypothetical protein [Lachnospiraceae bacterium]
MNENINSCPKCLSNNITYNREQSSAKRNISGTRVRVSKSVSIGGGKGKTTYQYKTVGLCKDCGHTWNVELNNAKKSRTWLWILIILFFPISLSVWFWKTERFNMTKKKKGIILAVVWVLLLAISAISNSNKKPSSPVPDKSIAVADTSEVSPNPSAVPTETPTIVPTKTLTTIPATPTVTPTKSEEKTRVIVNTETGKVHLPYCSKLPEEKNQLSFKTREKAVEEGYTDLCGICFK